MARQTFVTTVDELELLAAADRQDALAMLVMSSATLPVWIAWFIYFSDYIAPQDDGYYWIVPADGLGAWKRVNSSQDVPPAPPAG